MEFANLNWLAVAAGTIAAFGLGMIWFSPVMFGKAWAKGSQKSAPAVLIDAGYILAGGALMIMAQAVF